jgi:hypothetical protein
MSKGPNPYVGLFLLLAGIGLAYRSPSNQRRSPPAVRQLRAVLAVVREALRAEGVSTPGKVNLIFVLGALIVTIGTGAADLVQTIVRIWNADYETGLPSTLAFFALFVGAGLLCVLILALVPPSHRSGE